MIRNFAIIFNAIFWLELQGALIAAKIFHIYDFDGRRNRPAGAARHSGDSG